MESVHLYANDIKSFTWYLIGFYSSDTVGSIKYLNISYQSMPLAFFANTGLTHLIICKE
jgi:hypothetical protein